MTPRVLSRFIGCALAAGLLLAPGCGDRPTTAGREEADAQYDRDARSPSGLASLSERGATASDAVPTNESVPCTSEVARPAAGLSRDEKRAAGDPEDIPRYAENSPFTSEFKIPVVKEGKRLWADSLIWAKAPELIVETWLTEKPDTEGKYVLIEFWNTWCPPCRRSLAVLNRFHEKYGSELVVIGVCDEKPETVRNFKTHKIEFYSAIDTQARTKKEFGVFGVPHAVILEPEGYVIWEGFPLLKGYELTDKIIERILAIGRKQKEKEKAK